MMDVDWNAIDIKWQKKWSENNEHHIDPNEKDKIFAQKYGKSPGGAIKIHGLPNNKPWLGMLHLLKDWTYGCIAVTNKQMDEIYSSVKIGTKITILP